MLVCAVAITRFLFRSHCLYDVDSVGFGLALKHFDPAVFQPYPPGYFLYVYFASPSNTFQQKKPIRAEKEPSTMYVRATVP